MMRTRLRVRAVCDSVELVTVRLFATVEAICIYILSICEDFGLVILAWSALIYSIQQYE